ncbi:MAG: TIGR02281 family clan AA aspartic protease [Hyphomicrobiales bacterium]
MRQIMLFAAVLLVLGGVVAKIADKNMLQAATPAMSARTTVGTAPVVQASAGGRTMTVPRDARGHFQVEASINGRRLDFMIDTGASVIAMRESDAARLGIHPSPSDYTATVSTANGSIKAARAQFNSVDVGGIRIFDVAGLVLPDEALRENLLGLSFLSRLRRFEYANGKMVLEQ